MRRVTHLLYLHGFRSSPRSTKAQRMAHELAARRTRGHEVQYWCPQLPPSPAQAMREVMAGIADWPRESMAVMGSSLGGFYATVVAEALGCPAVLVNPAVEPARDLAGYIGEQTTWQDPAEPGPPVEDPAAPWREPPVEGAPADEPPAADEGIPGLGVDAAWRPLTEDEPDGHDSGEGA